MLSLMDICSGGQTGLRMETWVYKMGRAFMLLIWRKICYPLYFCPSESPLPLPFLHQMHPPIQMQSLQVRPQPRLGWQCLLQKEVGLPQPQLPPAFPTGLSSCCCCCFASGRVIPVQCNPGVLGASSSCRALAAHSGISFFFSKWLTTVVSRLLFFISPQKTL